MAASLAIGPSGQFDKYSFLKYTNKIGKACRNQALELICICRVFSFSRAAEQSFSQDAALSDVLQECDVKLAHIAKTDKIDKAKTGQWIKDAVRKLEEYEGTYHSSKQNTPESVIERMNKAVVRDEKESSQVRRYLHTSKMHRTRTKDVSRVVVFHLLKSITDTQPTLVPQAFTDTPRLEEILWNFCLYPHDSEKRITLVKNPHFYYHHRLPIKSPNVYDDEFTTVPMDHSQDVDDISVLTNKPGRVFLECGEKSRVFDNVWRTNGIFIFKDVRGNLDCESKAGAPVKGKPCKWCRVVPLPPQPEDWEPVQDWRDAIRHVLDSQDTKIRITISTESAARLPN